MLHIGHERIPACGGVTRRSFLTAGAAGLAGLSLPTLLSIESAGGVEYSKAKIHNLITIFLVGSPGHLDTWDMKPEAPDNIRGKFKPIDTNVPGIQICEHFPLMARMMDRVALIRGLYYTSGAAHENGQRWMMTGQDFGPNNVQPHCASVISRVFGPRGDLPASILLPGKIGNTGGPSSLCHTAAYLGSAHEPFVLNGDPANSDFKVANLAPPAGQEELRVSARRNLLAQVDELQRRGESKSTQELDASYARAFNLLTSPASKMAFELKHEPDKLRDRYGRNTLGQSCLMARRLIEGGSRCVTVNHFDTVFGLTCWDMHADGGSLNNTYLDYERHLCPQFDQAFTALIGDLEQRGMLQSTVVAVLSEFGRTPGINPRGGRDHYPAAWANFVCGGNFRGGQVVGSSDKTGAAPIEGIEPPRVLASLYHGMGVDLDTTMMPGPGGRPIRFIEAEPIRQLF